MQVVDNIVHKLSTGRSVGDLRMSKLKKELGNSDTDSRLTLGSWYDPRRG
jgi:hypothetical protein